MLYYVIVKNIVHGVLDAPLWAVLLTHWPIGPFCVTQLVTLNATTAGGKMCISLSELSNFLMTHHCTDWLLTRLAYCACTTVEKCHVSCWNTNVMYVFGNRTLQTVS